MSADAKADNVNSDLIAIRIYENEVLVVLRFVHINFFLQSWKIGGGWTVQDTQNEEGLYI